MPYVRKNGNQLLLVHGERDRETKEVRQRVLFTFYSQAEALEALGDSRSHFRRVVEDALPGVRFDWKKVDRAISAQMGVLPDIYPYRERMEAGFRESMVGFAKELLLHDPQTLHVSAVLLEKQRTELEYLRELIDRRLRLSKQEESEWNKDTPFFWRAARQRHDPPPEVYELLADLYNKRQMDELRAVAGLLVEAWPSFATGFIYLGKLAVDDVNYAEAVRLFHHAEVVARTLFPKRVAKESWWTNHDTRPYISALALLAQAHNCAGDYGKALVCCDRLEKECHQPVSANLERAAIQLNAGLFEPAAKSARYVVELHKEASFILAFALAEAGERKEALTYFVHGAAKYPRAARMIVDERSPTKPDNYDEGLDHNAGVALCRDLDAYRRSRRGKQTLAKFKAIIKRDEVKSVMSTGENARRRWSSERPANRKWFEKIHEIESIEFARDYARGIGSVLS